MRLKEGQDIIDLYDDNEIEVVEIIRNQLSYTTAFHRVLPPTRPIVQPEINRPIMKVVAAVV